MDILRNIRTRWIWVVVLTLIGLAGGAGYGYFTGGGYNATARLFVGTSARDANQAAQGNIAGTARVKTYAVLGTGPQLLEQAAQRSNTGVTATELSSKLSIVTIPDTVLIGITVRDDNATKAVAMADAVATELITLVQRLETPIAGGDPSVGLLTVQPAQSGVEKIGQVNVTATIAGGAIGLIVALVLTGMTPARTRKDEPESHPEPPTRDDESDPPTIVHRAASSRGAGDTWSRNG